MDEASSRRTDEQLAAILYETSTWSVNGASGEVLCTAASLRHAFQKAEEYIFAHETVTGVARRPHYDIIVYRAQLERVGMLVTSSLP
jgi:hypothetical protein